MRSIDGITLLEELGRGGMGAVYRGQHPTLGEVAVKVMLASGLDAEGLVRFRREMEAMCRLSHPSLVPIGQFGISEGRPYLVMPLLRGETVEERLRRLGRIPPPEAARIALMLADALSYAHGQGVLHRDVKPANVFLTQSDHVVLGDFGLALLDDESRLTQTGDVLGTPRYMAPEQALGQRERIGPASDVYGVGATLYEMLTGRPPFEGRNVTTTLTAVIEQPPPDPRESQADLDPELVGLCLRCLEKEPSRRFPDAAALHDELLGWLRRSGHYALVRRSRHAAVAAGLAGLGVLLAVLVLAFGETGQPPSSPAPTSPGAGVTASARPADPELRELVLQPGQLLGCDTFARGYGFYPNDNYGCDITLSVGWRSMSERSSQHGPVRAYLRFDELDRLPPDAKLERATLELYVLRTARDVTGLRVWLLAQSGGGRTPWREGSSTHDGFLDGLCWLGAIPWGNPGSGDPRIDGGRPEYTQPDLVPEAEGGLASRQELSRAEGWVELDVTGAVRQWLAGLENNGIGLTGLEEPPLRPGDFPDSQRTILSSDYPTARVRPRLRLRYRGSAPAPAPDLATAQARRSGEAEHLLADVLRRLDDGSFDRRRLEEDMRLAVQASSLAPFDALGFATHARLKLAAVPYLPAEQRGAMGTGALYMLRVAATRERARLESAELERLVREGLEVVRDFDLKVDQLEIELKLLDQWGLDYAWFADYGYASRSELVR